MVFMSVTERLASLRVEGKIVLSLISGFWGLGDYPKHFTELKRALNVSDPGLSKALRGLQAAGVVERDGRGLYRVKPEARGHLGAFLQPFYNDFLLERIRLVTKDLERFDEILSLIVFGSVAQGKADYRSDVDLLIVVERWDENLEREIHKNVSTSALKMCVPIEAIVISTAGLKNLLQHELQFLFGLLQGYITLYDRAGIASLFSIKKKKIESEYKYYEEIPIWLPQMR